MSEAGAQLQLQDVGVVVIGRNEGERLRRCLESVLRVGVSPSALAYVDSGSTDDSLAIARALNVTVVELDMSRPFTAARARNAGLDALFGRRADLPLVQFIDGDCELREGWLERAVEEFNARPAAAVVAGRLRERHPEASIYNRLADMEWETPIGEVEACGGIAMMRVAPFRAVGGFDPTVPAGEEPELCQRLRAAGLTIWRLDAEMAWHDSAMLHFRHWWKRNVRGGYGWMDIVHRFGPGPNGIFLQQVRSSRRWTSDLLILAIVWMILIFISSRYGAFPDSNTIRALKGAPLWGSLMLLLIPFQALRLAWKVRHRLSFRNALAYGALTLVSKWANLAGQIRWMRDHRAGRQARLIEHKAAHA